MIQKSQFAVFRNDECYVEMVNYFKEQMGIKAAELINRKEPNGNRDMYVRGVMAAYAEIVEWEPEFPAPEDLGENDEV